MAQHWGVMIGVRPIDPSKRRGRDDFHTHGFRTESDIPKELKAECESFVQGLKEIPKIYVDNEWIDSEYRFFELIIVAGSIATIISTALAIYTFHENRKKKRLAPIVVTLRRKRGGEGYSN